MGKEIDFVNSSGLKELTQKEINIMSYIYLQKMDMNGSAVNVENLRNLGNES